MIDALIRAPLKSQSEFGADKDVYSKRFQKVLLLFFRHALNLTIKNMLQTFQHLAKSAISSSDKEKCIKVVSHWRKGKIYEESLLDELESILLKTSASSKTVRNFKSGLGNLSSKKTGSRTGFLMRILNLDRFL